MRIGGLAHGQVGHEALALFGKAAHQIQHRVDDAPGQVAAERADEHRANIVAAGLGDAEGAGEREDHDQPEEDFGDALDRVQHALGGLRFIGISVEDLVFMKLHATRGGNRYSVMAKIA